jgi:hypothetical protein
MWHGRAAHEFSCQIASLDRVEVLSLIDQDSMHQSISELLGCKMTTKRIAEHIRRRMTLRATLRTPAGTNVYGFPMAVSNDVLLMREIYDYQFWGMVAIPRNNIASYRSGRYERFAETLLKAEGVTAKVGLLKWKTPMTLKPIFEFLCRLHIGTSVTTEHQAANAASGEERFYLGRILSVDDTGLFIRAANALGKWDRKSTRIDFAQVTQVGFDEPYIRLFFRHVPFPDEPLTVKKTRRTDSLIYSASKKRVKPQKTLAQLNAWLTENHESVLRLAEQNTVRLTGKSRL